MRKPSFTKWLSEIKYMRKENNSGNTPRIAIIGCGAIAESFHLPALVDSRYDLSKLTLIDTDTVRLEELASKFNVPNTLQDYRDVLNEVEGVIIALPHQLHYKISMEFLVNGVHVLCEKPLTESAQEAKKLVAQAEESGVTISVNHTRRLFPSYREIKKSISKGTIGDINSITYADGQLFNWPTISGFYFKKDSPKGVLFDKGIHGLDTICWWLGGKPSVISSENDSFGRMEGVALVKLVHNDCNIEVKLSWLNKLSNTYTIVGTLGTIEGGVYDSNSFTIRYKSGKCARVKTTKTRGNHLGHMMLTNFVDVVGQGAKPLVPASTVVPAIDLIEDCYKSAKKFSMPWY